MTELLSTSPALHQQAAGLKQANMDRAAGLGAGPGFAAQRSGRLHVWGQDVLGQGRNGTAAQLSGSAWGQGS